MVNFIVWLIAGAILGGITTLIVHRRRSIWLLNIALGSIGAFVAGYLLLPMLHISTISFSWLGLLVALGCSILLLALVNFFLREHTMAIYVIGDQWDLIRRKIHPRWSKITEEDIVQINGDHERLIGFIEQYYGVTKVEAEAQLQGFLMAVTHKVPESSSQPTRI